MTAREAAAESKPRGGALARGDRHHLPSAEAHARQRQQQRGGGLDATPAARQQCGDVPSVIGGRRHMRRVPRLLLLSIAVAATGRPCWERARPPQTAYCGRCGCLWSETAGCAAHPHVRLWCGSSGRPLMWCSRWWRRPWRPRRRHGLGELPSRDGRLASFRIITRSTSRRSTGARDGEGRNCDQPVARWNDPDHDTAARQAPAAGRGLRERRTCESTTRANTLFCVHRCRCDAVAGPASAAMLPKWQA